MLDPFNRSRLPAKVIAEGRDEFTREARVRLIGEAALDLLADRELQPEARLFLAGAIAAWLENGGNLERDFFRVVRPKSHATPSAVWKRLRAHQDERKHP